MFPVEPEANKGSVAGGRRPTLHILPFFCRMFFYSLCNVTAFMLQYAVKKEYLLMDALNRGKKNQYAGKRD